MLAKLVCTLFRHEAKALHHNDYARDMTTCVCGKLSITGMEWHVRWSQ